jgi:hypothetical protein
MEHHHAVIMIIATSRDDAFGQAHLKRRNQSFVSREIMSTHRVSHRIVQAIHDALEDLDLRYQMVDLTDDKARKELEALLRSKLEQTPPCLPFDSASALEHIHFLATTLQRDRLDKISAGAAATTTQGEDLSRLSNEQVELIKKCKESLQADYLRRRQHMRQGLMF